MELLKLLIERYPLVMHAENAVYGAAKGVSTIIRIMVNGCYFYLHWYFAMMLQFVTP